MSRAGTALLGLFRFHRSGLLVLALLVGVLSGLAAVAFRLSIDAWSQLLTGARDYTTSMGPSVGVLSFAGQWFVPAGLVVSALAVGLLMRALGRTSTGHGVSGVIWSTRHSDGTMRLVPALATTSSAALSIGAGGSVGPEGPITELGAAIGSGVGGGLGLPRRWVQVLAAAGAAAGISSAFDAPLAGAFFALEVILLDFTAETFGYVVVACVSSTVVSHHLLGTSLSLSLPYLNLKGDLQLGWVVVLGLLGGIVGTLFSRATVVLREAVRRLWSGPRWALPAAGSLPLAVLLLALPEMYGESSGTLDRALDARYSAAFLLLLVAAKVLATSLTLAVGFQGGVFAPSLFIGGVLGAWLGTLVSDQDPTTIAVFGVLGMGAVFTGAARAPITGVALVVEMTHQYDLLLPLMLAIALATATSRFLTRTTIYTEELRRRGDDVDDPVSRTLLGRTHAQALMSKPPAVLDELTSLAEGAHVLARAGVSCLPVVSRDQPQPEASAGQDGQGYGVLLGTVSAAVLSQATLAGGPGRPVASLLLDSARVGETDTGSQVLETLVDCRLDGLPVTRPLPDGQAALVGWISQDSLVRRLYRQQCRAVEADRQRSSFGSRTQQWWARRQARR